MDEAELARWLKDRLTGDQAKIEWRSLFESSWETFLDTKVADLLPPEKIEALMLAELTRERLAGFVHALVRADLAMTVEIMRSDRERLGRWVPDEARGAIMALVAKKGFIDPEWVRSIFKEEAIEAILSDTLYHAIREFSALIPRLIQTQVLGRLGRLGGLGGGIGTRILEEVEKLLEPEIRRFLDKGTRRALDGAGRFAVEHVDDPVSLDFRRNMVAFVLDQEVAFHARALSDDVVHEIDRIAELIAHHVADREETKLRVREVIGRLRSQYADRTLGAVLTELGAPGRPPLDAWADATWPALVLALDSSGARAFLERIARELHALMSV
jgi:hypothetical protein